MKQRNRHQLGSWRLRAPCQGRTSYDGPPWPCRRRIFEAACPALAARSGSASLPSSKTPAAARSSLLLLAPRRRKAPCRLASPCDGRGSSPWAGTEGCSGGTAVAAWQAEMQEGRCVGQPKAHRALPTRPASLQSEPRQLRTHPNPCSEARSTHSPRGGGNTTRSRGVWLGIGCDGSAAA